MTTMTTTDAFEQLGELVSQAGGQGDAALDALKDRAAASAADFKHLGDLIERVERQFARAQTQALDELHTLIEEAERAIELIENEEGFVRTFAGGGITFSGHKAEDALSTLATTRDIVGLVR